MESDWEIYSKGFLLPLIVYRFFFQLTLTFL